MRHSFCQVGPEIQGRFRDEARQAYQHALKLDPNCVEAYRHLAMLYANGQGVERDYAEAANWVRKAAEQGYAPAQACLGIMYWNAVKG